MNPEPIIKPGEIITWMGLAFETNDQVLVPRRETELLARTALDLLKTVEAAAPIRVIDMCCGAGNLSCALAHARPDIRVCASDLTDACVTLARRNVVRHGLEGRVDVRQGDLFSSLPEEELVGAVDLIVCNPPYISTGKLEGESAHLLDRQPREAFDAGPYGLAVHQRVIADATRFLKPGGWLVMEIGLGQQRQISLLFSRIKRYEKEQSWPDNNGSPRVMGARLLSTR
jgi:release factor glutamine methyltransferase